MIDTGTATVLQSSGVEVRQPRLPSGPVVRATIVGSFAVLLWALWPSLAVVAAGAPPFLLLSVAFTSAFGVFLVQRLFRRQPLMDWITAPPATIALGLIGVCAANIFYILSLRAVPAAEANIISYTWPIMIVTLAAGLGWVRARKRHVAAILTGFVGAVVIIGPSSFFDGTWYGYLLALLSAFSWSVYSVARLHFRGGPQDIIGGVCGLSAPICLAVHLAIEPSYASSLGELAAMVAIGVGPVGSAITFWDYGVRHGEAKHLAIFAYATPLLATILLVAFGLSQVTLTLFLGGALITAAAVLGNADLAGNKQKSAAE